MLAPNCHNKLCLVVAKVFGQRWFRPPPPQTLLGSCAHVQLYMQALLPCARDCTSRLLTPHFWCQCMYVITEMYLTICFGSQILNLAYVKNNYRTSKFQPAKHFRYQNCACFCEKYGISYFLCNRNNCNAQLPILA